MVFISYLIVERLRFGLTQWSTLGTALKGLSHSIGEELGRPPILSYASYCLDNWHKINDDEGVNLNNVALNYNFLGGIDEDWFVTIHVCIEHAANLAIASAFNIALAYQQNTADEKTLLKELTNIKTSMLFLIPNSVGLELGSVLSFSVPK